MAILKPGLLDTAMTFIIPVFNNMPEIPSESPSINSNDFIQENQNVYCNASNVNIRTGPSTSYEVITKVNNNDKMTRIAKGKQAGERWDKVILENGIVGYAFQNYLKEIPEVEISQINLSFDRDTINKNESVTLKVEILPQEAKQQKITFSSSDPSIINVDENGNIFGIKSGEATITATAQNGVKGTIKIKVYSKVTDMNLDISNLTLQQGEEYKLNFSIMPEDASNKNVVFSSENKYIASVDSNGKIIALKEGNTKIIVTSQDSNIQKSVDVKVIQKISEDELKFDESLKIQGNIISGFNYKNMNVNSIKSLISTKYDIQIENYKGEILEGNQLVGTNSKIKIIDETQNTILEYKIILYGDINGDGKINSVDLLVLQRHILEIEKIDEIFQKAGNINKNGKKPTSVDLLLIQRHILELQIIEQ